MIYFTSLQYGHPYPYCRFCISKQSLKISENVVYHMNEWFSSYSLFLCLINRCICDNDVTYALKTYLTNELLLDMRMSLPSKWFNFLHISLVHWHDSVLAIVVRPGQIIVLCFVLRHSFQSQYLHHNECICQSQFYSTIIEKSKLIVLMKYTYHNIEFPFEIVSLISLSGCLSAI